MEAVSSLAPTSGVEITVIVDRSGSMSTIADEVSGGLRSFAAEQPPGALFNVVQFDTEYEVVFSKASAAAVQDFLLVPRGMTALHDAIGKTIFDLRARYRADGHPSKVVVVILTDGYENASLEFRGEQVGKMIEECQAAGWQFAFLGANQNAVATGQKLNLPQAGTLTYAATGLGVREAFRSTTRAVSNYAVGASDSVCYSADDRIAQARAGVDPAFNIVAEDGDGAS